VDAPDELPFSELVEAADDYYIMPSGTSTLDVSANDVLGRRVSMTVLRQPNVGSVWVQDGNLVVEIPDNATDNIVFEYRLDNGTEVSDATVVISPQQQLSWGTVDASFVDSDTETTAGVDIDGTDASDEEASGIAERLQFLTRPPTVWLSLVDLQLPLLPLTSAASVSLFGLLLLWRRGYLRRYATVRGVARGEALAVDGTGFLMRHNADQIWRTGRKRRRAGTVQIETPAGYAWVQESLLETPDH